MHGRRRSSGHLRARAGQRSSSRPTRSTGLSPTPTARRRAGGSTAKRRPEAMPCALLAPDLDVILDAVPELRGRAAVTARALLPGPYTLVLPNPARRFRWLCGTRPETIGDPRPRASRRGAGGRRRLRRRRLDERERPRRARAGAARRPPGGAARGRRPRWSTEASCPARRRRSSTSPDGSRRSCARAPFPRPRRSPASRARRPADAPGRTIGRSSMAVDRQETCRSSSSRVWPRSIPTSLTSSSASSSASAVRSS